MSLFLPFRNVTVAGFGRRVGVEPVRSAAPARRPPHGPRASVGSLGLETNSADFEQSSIALIASARSLLAPGFAPCNLLLADNGETGADPLVLDNLGLLALPQLVEGAV